MNSSKVGKILVVDDEIELKNVLVEALASQGYETTGFTNGKEALVTVREQTFDILLTDLMMPGMDGITLVRESLQIDPNLICIVMTGQGTIQTAVDAMKIGAFDYVLKPFRLATMMPVLTRAMNSRHLRLENVQLREAVAIHELCETIAFTLDPQTVLSKLADAALLQSEADEVSVLMPVPDAEEFYVAAVRGERRERLLGERVPFGDTVSSWVAREHESVILHGEIDDDRFVALWPRPEIRSSVSIPMLISKKLIGVLSLNMVNRPRRFTLGQMKALTILAGTAAAALESASLYREVLKAEKEYRSIFENAVDGIFRATPDAVRFLSVNPFMAQMFGYESPAEMIDVVEDITLQLGLDPVRRDEALDVLRKQGVLEGFKARVRRKDGSEIWISANVRAICDAQGELAYLDGIVQDITERRRAEEALRASEAELRALFASMTDVIIVYDDQGRHLKIAPTKTPSLYRPAEERIGKTLHEVFPQDKADFFLAQIRKALATNRTHRVEYSLSIDEREFWYDASISPMTKSSVIWVARDITERKRAQEEQARLTIEIEKQRERLDSLISSVPGIVWEAWGQPDSVTQRINFVSEYVETMLGYSVEEWLSTPNFWLQIVHPDDKERTAKAAAADFANGQSVNTLEFRWVAKDGRSLWVESTSVVIRDENNRPVGVRGVTLDISERKRAEAELRKLSLIIEHSRDLIGIASPEGPVLFLNPAGMKMVGLDGPEQALTTNLIDYVSEEGRAEAGGILRAILRDGHWEGETVFRNFKTGAAIPMLQHAFLVTETTNNEGPVVATICRDITDRKRVEAELRFQKTLLESQSEASIDGILVTSDEHEILSFNQRFVELWEVPPAVLGVRSDEAAIQSVIDKLEDPDQFLKGVEYLYEHPEQSSRDEIALKDGRTFDRYTAPIKSTEDKCYGRVWFFRDITDRKRAEEILRESETQFKELFDEAPVAYHELDREGRISRVNLTEQRLLGYDAEEMQGRFAWEFIVEEGSQQATAAKLSGKMVLKPFERTFIRKDGALVPMEVEDRLLYDADGAICGIRSTLHDITERKRAEQALRDTQQRYRDLVENAHDIIYSHDLQGNYTSVNQAGKQITGYTHDETLTMNIADTVAPEYADRIQEMIRRKLAGDEATAYEMEILAKDGHRVTVEVNTKLMFQDGVPVGVQGIARDITERKKAQADLARLAMAVEQTADSIVITDTDGNIEYVNPAFERVTGYPKDEVLGQNPRILKSGKVDASTYRQLWETITSGNNWSGQLVNRKKDGTLFTERSTISAVRDEHGKISHYLAVKQDTTHEMQLEEQLRQSQKMEAIGQLAGGVAHDFNNLLTAINGYSSLALQRLDDTSSIKPYLEEVKKAGDRAANLTRQLLAFGRKQILQPLPINLNDVVTDMSKMLQRLIGEDITLIARPDPALRKTQADPGQIEQVLMNLVVNARDAMPQGGSLTIETANVELDSQYAGKRVGVKPGSYVMLAVSDTGSGMTEETRTRIFDPFFTTKEKGKGTGLGLSTVYGIITQSGGNVWVYSELNRGTTFKVYLPQIESAVSHEKIEIATVFVGGSETILLVEDEEVVRHVTSQILGDAGYQVIAAAQGEEAVRLCRENKPSIDMLLTDVVMPQLSGKEVAEQVKELVPGLKVLFMSGYTDEAIVHHGVLDSNIEFIQKPFTPLGLTTKVREVLDTNGKRKRSPNKL